MLAVSVNQPGFQYELHALVSAFYPGVTVKVVSNDDLTSSTGGLPDIMVGINGDQALFASFTDEGPQDVISADLDGVTDKAVRKQLVGRLVYMGLNQLTGKRLPWGTLTGIRPVKLVSGLIRDGLEEADLKEYMQTVYMISDEKLALASRIAMIQQPVVDSLSPEGFSLYIGIPFCPSRCLYCSFTSYPADRCEDLMDPYLEALFREIDFAAERFAEIGPDSIYIGGGTPTSLSPERLCRLLEKVNSSFDRSRLKEFTVEAGRPDSIDAEKLRVLKEAKVSRISINPQTMNPETLGRIGRKHTPEDIIRAFEISRKAGFRNINADIILGLPGEGPSEVKRTMEEIEKLSPESLTVHSLAIKRSSKLKEELREDVSRGAIENTEEMMRLTSEGAARMGMDPYYLYRQKNIAGNFENTGYAKAGCYGIYNVAIMEEVQSIVALGAGTVTKRVYPGGRIERCDTVKDLKLYLEKTDEMIERKRKLFDGD
ncbi:MAG: coproporphyrinogen dehydrogenase HemZ [Lachnospiraceae bacterium]|nr:coproporphyrinogen dehydrogenase HemZ [Lachnospiraceae bacterium]